ncbi:MAG: prolyl oligopeptidase family serine peptidase [Bacteroidota bacterium]|nr:prolyl oligopeptidase family serine peptidase [Bacteroidota bacterium]
MKRIVLLILLLIPAFSSFSQNNNKKNLDHSVYEKWNVMKNIKISNNGNWVTYISTPQKTALDSKLFLFDVKKDKLDFIDRGEIASFSPNSDFLIFKIKAQYDSVRKMKLEKVKKDELPKDSMGIWLFDKDSIIKIPRITSFKIAEKNSSWIVYHLCKEKKIKEKEVADSNEVKKEKKSKAEKKKMKKEKKQIATHLVIFNPISEKEFLFKNVKDYSISKNGNSIVFTTIVKDSIDTISLHLFNTLSQTDKIIYKTTNEFEKFTIDEEGKKVAFLISRDTTKTKIFSLLYWNKDKVEIIVDTTNTLMPKGFCVSKNASIYFSKNGEKLFFGIAKKPEPEVKDTLLENEKYHLDVWNWKDLRLQPQQKLRLKSDLKKSDLCVFNFDKNKMIKLENENIQRVRLYKDRDARYALGFGNKQYQRSYSWTSKRCFDAYLLDTKTGEQKLLLKKRQSSINISPDQKYIYWYESNDSSWYSKKIGSDEKVNLTEKINVSFFNEDYDVPTDPHPYGIAGWSEKDENIFIYDKYDIWKIDPKGKKHAIKITNGREQEIIFRNVNLDREKKYLEGTLVLKAFNKKNKKEGFFTIEIEETKEAKMLIMQDYSFRRLQKAKNCDKIIWRKESFKEYPQLRISNIDFKNQKVISNLNPQQQKYNWGTVEQVAWTSFEGEELKGLLYKPENFDASKKYPMIVYYYEKGSDNINQHSIPKPSHSVISFPLYVSNGYLIFVPDINYKKGFPGKSAYQSIMSGTMAMCEKDFVDKKNIGLQGQSWGGYQTVFMLTQTNFYKAAMGGAVVSNMTSAYGGIRWGSGVSRMFQYEEGQSRIGATLWEKPELYIENSPIFFADRIETPLLLMHNDNDGAVPWYQGIEMFVAMRRLNKPAWMLSYNNEAHNLRKWPNRVDLSIRMMQFFDYYLKNKPMPIWMEEGIPATQKGKIDGYKLIENKN